MAKKHKPKAIKAVSPERVPTAKTIKEHPMVVVMYHTDKGRGATDSEHAADMKRINAFIAEHGGKCSLYGDESDHMFVTIVRGLSAKAKGDLAKVIGDGGNVTVTQMSPLKD